MLDLTKVKSHRQTLKTRNSSDTFLSYRVGFKAKISFFSINYPLKFNQTDLKRSFQNINLIAME